MRIVRYLFSALLAASGLVLAVGPGTASAAPRAGHSIATAGTLAIGKQASGGGGPIDFWKVHLFGGDQVQLLVKSSSGNAHTFYFELFRPGTTDENFPVTPPLLGTYTTGTTSVLKLMAPYNGTFVLAVCEDISNDCRDVDNGGGTNPMNSYTFAPTLINGGIPARVADKETRAGASITKAPLLPVGNFEAGGGNAADFWKVHLFGGDKVQLIVKSPYGDAHTFYFELFRPGTTDENFPVNPPVLGTYTTGQTSVLMLQAPYNGTFILAVCEDISNDCRDVDNGGGTNPMLPYTFTPTLIHGGIPARVADKEKRAGASITKAPLLPVGNFEAGGGDAIDFWKVHMFGGDQVRLAVQATYGDAHTYYFQLYRPGTTDGNFPVRPPLESRYTTGLTSNLGLHAPYTGTFIFAVCEDISNDCRDVLNGGGTNPMQPYTFTPTLTGGRETRTTLNLSASSVTYGHEKSLKLSVTVAARFAGHPTPGGKATVLVGKKVVCTLTLSRGKGACSPRSNTLLGAGTYSLVAAYAGNSGSLPSHSAARTLKVKKAA